MLWCHDTWPNDIQHDDKREIFLVCIYSLSKFSSLNTLHPLHASNDLYYKHIMIISNDSRVIRMMLQVVTSPMNAILTTLEVSFTHLENIYSTGVTHDDRHMMIIIYL